MVNLQKWQVLSSQMLINHPFCQVRRDAVALPNGKVIDDFFVYIKPDIAVILPITNNGEVVFVRQYRHAGGEFFIELPAGRFDAEKEDPEAAALRELREETGYVAGSVRKIAVLYDNPSKETNQIHLFLAENVVKVGEQENLDITEEIEVILIPVNAVFDKIMQGEISVAGTVAALFLGLRLRGVS
ncbi:NUDIX hydrolase [Sphaerospermopsis aphanizomenoides BCCUSP55]|uniref:NUDIX hydrolase n=1 Tax=Sphaerospermopsis aphanizomenoides TaxID=459663 RepID=UPI000ADA59ED|nr:NUDIX hydrolase [Sphaerospermopsis aphanizomenoides]MBK1987586.1 NUDIX hydrolase [Sphaerospermopsis aphanizomenoides BCCUSP55]